jgi:hypothetical protein
MGNLNWIFDLRSRALLALSHGEEAIEEMAAGRPHSELGDANVSQTLTWGPLPRSGGIEAIPLYE